MSANAYVVIPPYSGVSGPNRPDEIRALPPGSILFLDQAEVSVVDLVMDAQGLARSNPAAILLVGVEKSDPLPSEILDALHSSGLGTLLQSRPPQLPMLLDAARAASRSVVSQLIIRLRLLGREMTPFLETATRALFGSVSSSRADDWAAQIRLAPRTLRRRLGEAGAPPPHRWVELDHVIHATLILQRDRHTLVPEALDEAGFTSPKVGRGTFKRVAGMPAREARSLIGWHWIIERWVELYWPSTREGRGAAPAD